MLKKFPSLLVINAVAAAIFHLCLVMAMNGPIDGEAGHPAIWADLAAIAPGAVLIFFAVLGLGMIHQNQLMPASV